MADPLFWERVIDNLGSQTFRAAVYGGWLVRDRDRGLTFVSDPNLEWAVDTRPAVIPEPPRVLPPPPAVVPRPPSE
jgi:hypothetical protein